MSQEPSIDPQPGEIGDGVVEIHGATEITGRRGIRPADATTGAQPVHGPPIAADSPEPRGEHGAEYSSVPAPIRAPAPMAGGASAGPSPRRRRARAGAVALILGAGASVLAAVKRRRDAARRPAPVAQVPAATAVDEAPQAQPQLAPPSAPSAPPADVEVSLTAGVTADDDPTTLTSGDAKHLDLPQERRRAEAEAADAEREAAAPGPSEGAANVSLTAGVIPPDARTPTADERRD